MDSPIRNLDYVVLLCRDLERMASFYQHVMGFPLYRSLENWIEMQVGSTLLALRKRGRPYDGPEIHGSAAVQLAFRVPPGDVDRWHQRLLDAKVEILEAPRSQDYGHRTLFFKDPEGNIVEIFADI